MIVVKTFFMLDGLFYILWILLGNMGDGLWGSGVYTRVEWWELLEV